MEKGSEVKKYNDKERERMERLIFRFIYNNDINNIDIKYESCKNEYFFTQIKDEKCSDLKEAI